MLPNRQNQVALDLKMSTFLKIILFLINPSFNLALLKGVSEINAEFYKPNEEFSCLDGLLTIPYSKVNDDYCDCQDSSDEPETSACPNGIFHCQNIGFEPVNIPSSMVNDGICDCCDGSDEFNQNRTCQNTCTELSHAAQIKQIKLSQYYMAAGNKRLDLIREGRKIKLRKIEKYNYLKEKKFELNQKKLQLLKNNEAEGAERLENILPGMDHQEDGLFKGLLNDVVLTDEDESLDPEAKELNDLNEKIKIIEFKINKIESFFKSDFGAEGEFVTLSGSSPSFELKESDYRYTIQMFDKITQNYNLGGTEIVLGVWSGWVDSLDSKYKQMKFENGASCWGTADRSALITLMCGLDDKVLNVTEPNKCQYLFYFETPRVCYEYSKNVKLEVDEMEESDHFEL